MIQHRRALTHTRTQHVFTCVCACVCIYNNVYNYCIMHACVCVCAHAWVCPCNAETARTLCVDPSRLQTGDPTLLYVVYRLAMATFFGSSTIYSVMYFDSYAKWFIYLTHWSYAVLTLNTILQAACVTRHYIHVHNKATDKGETMTSPIGYSGNVV